MKRIFYFTGHRLTVLHWSKKSFAGACSFEPDEQGFAKFDEYLNTSAKLPTKLVIDVIEEDFRKVTVPRVYGKDRKAVISRVIDRNYRASGIYTYHEIQGRVQTGRRDNELLIGAITDADLINPWVEVIERAGVPLTGIWSLPLLSKTLLPYINAKKGAVLLVTQQVNSNLRQTYFKDGKMISSRQSVINQDATDITNIGSLAEPEVERTIMYLRNQKLLGYDEEINVHFIVADEQIASLEEYFISNELHQYTIHKIREIHIILGLEGLPEKFSDGFFAWLCLSRRYSTGHYGSKSEFNRYYYSLASNALYAASVVVAIIALIFVEANISDVITYSDSITLHESENSEYQKKYKSQFSSSETLLKNADSMNKSVNLVHQIREHGNVSPLDFMIELSSVISSPDMDTLMIDRIEWTSDQVWDPDQKNKTRYENRNNVTSKNKLQHVAIISGKIPVSSESYREAVNRVNKMIAILMDHERIVSVEAIKLPVEVRSEKKFAAKSVSNKNGDVMSEYGIFSFRVVMQAPGNA